MANATKSTIRGRLHQRIRKKVKGSTNRPRLNINFSGQHIYVQVIDDIEGRTLAAVATTEKEWKSKPTTRANVSTAAQVGKLIAQRAKDKKIETVVFDRGGFKYHGKVKALADAAREEGLKF